MREHEPDEIRAGLNLVDKHRNAVDGPTEFDLLGLRWELHPGVFAPIYTASTELFSTWLPFPTSGRFLEVGSGAGITAVYAALQGCGSVTAVDISEAAVRNTVANVGRHRVRDRVRVMRSDVFDTLDPGERFDLIFWNGSVIAPPSGFEYTDDLQRAFFDRDYAANRRYVQEGRRRLSAGGRLLLGFNNLGRMDLLEQFAAEAGASVVLNRKAVSEAGDITVEFRLLEFVPVTSR